jgi:hypothetical protein
MLPKDAHERARTFRRLSEPTKGLILGELAKLSPESRERAIKEKLDRGGTEADFLAHVFSKPVPGEKDSPDNKKVDPPQTK